MIEATPLWVCHTDRFLNSGSGTFSLPNLTARHVTLRLEAPQADLDLLRTRFDATRPAEADLSVTHDAICDLSVERGLSTDCLPACGTIEGGAMGPASGNLAGPKAQLDPAAVAHHGWKRPLTPPHFVATRGPSTMRGPF